MNELKLNDVYLNYFGHRDSIIGFSHTFFDGINVVYGEEGSGKTSLLKLIAGINTPIKGDILLNGKPIDYKKDVQMVFDDLALFERRSLKYNLEYSLRVRRVPKDEQRLLIDKGLEYFSVESILLSSKAFRLKNIDRVKSALIRTTYRSTPILLLDNPLRSLSGDERKSLFLKLLSYLSTREGIIIYATDLAEEAVMLNAPITVLSFGYKQDSGLAQEMQDNPHCLLTAKRFIPYFNTLEGQIVDNEVIINVGKEIRILLEGNDTIKVYNGKKVLVGIPFDGLRGVLEKEKGYSITYLDKKIDVYDIDGDTLFVLSGEKALELDEDKVLLFDFESERLIYPNID